ncbi:MAG: TRAP transporter substrate-binding protein DctP [Rhodospirillales bacterium]|nr:TRAP transporter substrate-binding protein DctP [Rhodospirillales bacterium]
MSKITTTLKLATVAAIASTIGVQASVGMELKAVTGLQQTNTLAKSFLIHFKDAVNARGKGGVSVKYLGGQNIVPPRKAAKALKRGQFDMLHSPTAYYIGMVPEGYAMTAANVKPAEVRANGGWKILEEVFEKKAGSHLIAWGESGSQYNMYLMFDPKLDKNGVPDLSGVNMRATGTYRPLFKALGATTINMKSSEIYTGLQRGVVKGFGWPNVAIVPLGLHKIVKYRISPPFYHSNNVVTMNLESWAKLSGKAKSLINSVALEYETNSAAFMEEQRLKEEKIVLASGVKDIKLTGGAAKKYLSTAYSEIWKQLKKRSEYSDKLHAKFYRP